jgi:paraquat-inducible protein B
MSEESGGSGGVPEGIPRAAARSASTASFSLVWFIPLVAVVIGGWIAWQAISEQGPEITIAFKSASGLEAGKTKVSYKDLQVGSVKAIELAPDLTHVTVTAELSPNAADYLTENTRFWVVRPQVSAGRVTGLGTLLSGAYIAMDPVREGAFQDEFVGLETPPVVTTSEEGSVFTLRSRELGSVDVGAPVYYRQLQVGEVASFVMDESGGHITTKVFVRAPHDNRVRSNTRFWNASGLDVTLDAEGIRVETTSIVSMLIGGLAFDTPDADDPGTEVGDEHAFTLFSSRRDSEQPVYTVKRRYLLYFDNSVQGLVPGSPVVFRGIRIGRVIDVKLELDSNTYGVRVPVVIQIEPERIAIADNDVVSDAQALGRIERLVANGMRARLGSSNLLTGAQQVEIDMYPDLESATVVLGGRYPELPTIPAPLDEITASISGVVAKIDRLPLEQIGRELAASLTELRQVLAGFNEDVMPSLSGTLANLDSTVGHLDNMLAEDAPLPLELRRAVEDVGEAARSVRVLTDYLEQHPESLIRGKK